MEREELKSLNYSIKNDINKSLEYEVMDHKVVVDGESLKNKLSTFLLDMIMRKNQIFREMELLSEQVGEQPVTPLDEYETKGFRTRIQTLPQKYNWSQIYPNSQDGVLNPEKNEKGELMSKYNNKVHCYIDLAVDCLIVKTMIDNIKVDQSYPIKTIFATKIGF